MKRHLLATTALVVLPAMACLGQPVQAGSPASMSWTGFYLGVQAGGSSSNASLSGAFQDQNSSSSWSSGQSWSAALIGGFAGYDIQLGRFVVGIEGDINARPGDGTGTLPSVYGINVTGNWKSEVTTWDASVRARFGVLVMPQILVYVTGGAAFSNFKFSNAAVTSFNQVYWGNQDIYGGRRAGWTVGAGTQYAISRFWNARLEYRHTDYGTKSGGVSFDSGKSVGSFRSKITDERFTGGLAYKF